MRTKTSSTSARAVALTALYRVDHKGAYVNLALAELLEGAKLDARDRAFATELTYGTLRWRGRIDWVLSHFVRRPMSSQHPYVRNLLRLGVYQLLFLSNVPSAAAVSEAVSLAKGHRAMRHAASFVNAVLRKVATEGRGLTLPSAEDDPVVALSVDTSHPEWMVRRWTEQYGTDLVRPFMLANNEPAPLSGRANLLRCSVEGLVARLHEEGVPATPSPTLPTGVRLAGAPGLAGLPSFRDGWFTAQDEGSQVVAWAVDPQPGETVWDLCSAPGTKTTHLAELMGDEGCVMAVDIHGERLRLVEEGCKRLGLRSIRILEGDARTPPGEPGSADRVLVDAPCSGVGVLRRRPDLRWHRQEHDMADLVALQREILIGASRLVRSGGVLVYSTCSVDWDENEGNMRWFLQECPAFRLDSLEPVLPATLLDTLSTERLETTRKGYLQLWPHLDGTDGFFIARFVRK